MIERYSQGRFSDPECEQVDRDFDETTYHCTAAGERGHRIKLLVGLLDDNPNATIIAWPCVPAAAPWRAIRLHGCAKPVR